jgi:hypothetical protein
LKATQVQVSQKIKRWLLSPVLVGLMAHVFRDYPAFLLGQA